MFIPQRSYINIRKIVIDVTKIFLLVLKNIKIVVDLSFTVCRFGSGGYKETFLLMVKCKLPCIINSG